MYDIDRHITEWVTRTGLPIEELLRLLLAAVVGGLVGLEREVRGRQAGFRTNLLVCVGSALVMIVSTSLAHVQWVPGSFQITVDPGRIAYGVMTGIGFLGAGTILQHKGSIRGLTTAAALWCVAAVGLAAGLGMYMLCILAGVLILTALWVLDYFEAALPRMHYRTVTIRTPWRENCVGKLVQYFKSHGLNVVDVSFQRTPNLESVDINLQVAFLSTRHYLNLEHKLQGEQDGYQLLAVSREP